MKIPKYIENHIKANNKLLQQAAVHDAIIMEWYEKQLNKFDDILENIDDEELTDVKENFLDNGEINIANLKYNLEMLEETRKDEFYV